MHGWVEKPLRVPEGQCVCRYPEWQMLYLLKKMREQQLLKSLRFAAGATPASRPTLQYRSHLEPSVVLMPRIRRKPDHGAHSILNRSIWQQFCKERPL